MLGDPEIIGTNSQSSTENEIEIEDKERGDSTEEKTSAKKSIRGTSAYYETLVIREATITAPGKERPSDADEFNREWSSISLRRFSRTRRTRIKYDSKADFVADIEHPTLFQRKLTFPEDPVWYKTIRMIIFVWIMALCFDISDLPNISTPQNAIIVVLYVFYTIDVVFSFLNQHLLRIVVAEPNPIAKPIWVFVISTIAIIPVEYTIAIIPVEYFFVNNYIWYLTRGKVIILIIRLVYEYLHDIQLLEMSLLSRIWAFIIALTCTRIFFGSILINLLLSEALTLEFFGVFALRKSLLLYSGNLTIWQEEIPLIIHYYIDSVFLVQPAICLMMFTYMQFHRTKYSYISNVHLFTKVLVPRFDISENNSKRIMEYTHVNWNMRDKYMLLQSVLDENVFCHTMVEAMFQDRNLLAIQHCPMFRNLDYYLHRFLAQKIKPRFYLNDNYLYKFPLRKTYMFYIASGEVDIISHEDGQTDIIKLTAGTCIGTAILVRPFRTNTNVRTSTQCEIYELKTKDFCDFARIFPLEYRNCVKFVQSKIDQAIFLKHVKKVRDPTSTEYNIIWLKRQLHRFMGMKTSNPGDHKVTNIYLMKDLETAGGADVLYTKMNLDVLSIKPRNTQYNDMAFIKPTCLWVFHPESPILKNMWKLMCLVAIASNIIFGYEAVMARYWKTELLHWAIVVLMILEVLVLSMTPINFSMPRNMWDMFIARCNHLGFVCDVISTIGSVSLHLFGYHGVVYFLVILRLWRIFDVYQHIENNVITNLFTHQLTFYVCFYLFLWHQLGLLFIYNEASPHDTIFSVNAILFALGHGYYDETTAMSSKLYSVPSFALVLLRIIITSLIASSYHLMKYDYISIACELASTAQFVDSATIKKNNHSLMLRLHSFKNLLINDYQYLQANQQNFVRYPGYIELLMKPERLMKYMHRSKFFRKFPKDFVKDLVTCSKVETYCENAMILTRGVRYNSLFILIDGEVCSIELANVRRVPRGSDMNFLEIIFDVPSVRNFVALSHVLCATIPFDKFMLSLLKFRESHTTYLSTIKELQEEHRTNLISILQGKPIVVVEVSKESAVPSFYTFRCVMLRESFEAYDYFPIFDKLGIFSFVRFFLLHVTFHPEGRFFVTWEIFRVTCACFGIIVFLLPAFIQASIRPYVLIFDFVGYIDMYIRFHVCYYSPIGLLIVHPLKTAKHYFSRSFVIDVLSVLPLQYYSKYTNFRTFIRAMRSIQLYRAIGFKNYVFNETFIFSILGLAYVSIVFIVASATLIFECDCPNSTITHLQCENMNVSRPLEAYFSLILITTGAATSTFLSGEFDVTNANTWTRTAIAFTCLFGVFWGAVCLAYAFNSFIIRNVYVNGARSDIRKLLNFMKYNKLSKILIKHVDEYFEIQWKWYDMYRSQEVIHNMNTSLQRDFLFHIYGDPYIRFNNFTTDYRNLPDFYKSILVESNNIICPSYGKFITVNDIESSIYFIYRGAVEISTIDGSTITTMYAGGIFGNLLTRTETRQKITATAKCNSQCLRIQSSKLHDILDYYPKIKANFLKATVKNPCIIKSKAKSHLSYPTFTKAMKRNYKARKVFSGFHSITVCYIGNILNFYQIATGEENIYFISALYALDFLHVIEELTKYFSPTINEFGYWCTSIKEKYQIKGSKSAISMAVVTSIPLDLCVWFGSSFPNRTYWFSALRVNRVLRIYYIGLKYFELMSLHGTAWSIAHKTIIIFYELIYLTVFISTILAIADPIATSYIYKSHLGNVPIDEVLNIRSLAGWKKFKYFINYFFLSLLITVRKSHRTATVEPPVMHILTSILLLFAFLMYIIILCQTYDIIDDIYSRKAFLSTLMFNKLLKKSTVYTDYIKKRIVTNARYVFSKDRKRCMRAFDENTPIYLREMILISSYGYLLINHPIFKYCHSDFLRQLGRCFKLVDIPKGFEVMHKFDHRKCMFFLLKGSVVILQEDGDIIDNYLFLLKPGDCFCFQLGLNQQTHAQFTYTCRQSSTILELEYDAWKHLINFFPATKDILNHVGDQFSDEPFLTLVTTKKMPREKVEKEKQVKKRKHRRVKNKDVWELME